MCDEAQVPLSSVGMIVLDRHFDGQIAEFAKSTFLYHLLREKNGIGGVSVLGVPTDTQRELVDGIIADGNERIPLQEIVHLFYEKGIGGEALREAEGKLLVHTDLVRPMRGRLHIGGDIWQGNQVHRPALTREIEKTFAQFAQRGIKHVYFSCDMDVMDMLGYGITATDYNPHAGLAAWGMQDATHLLQEYGISEQRVLDIRNATEAYQKPLVQRGLAKSHQAGRHMTHEMNMKMMQAQVESLYSPLAQMLTEIAYPHKQVPPGLRRKGVFNTWPESFRVEDIRDIAQAGQQLCKRYSMGYGVPLGESQLVVDVTEVHGKDYKDQTAAMTDTIMSAFLHPFDERTR